VLQGVATGAQLSGGGPDFKDLHAALAAYEYGHYCFSQAVKDVRVVCVRVYV
jgi:hypothetical protein